MKSILTSLAIGIAAGATAFVLINNLFERPNKSVKEEQQDPEPSIVYEDDEDTIKLEKAKVGS